MAANSPSNRQEPVVGPGRVGFRDRLDRPRNWVIMGRGRPHRPIGVAGTIKLTELSPGHWNARVRVRDATGKRRDLIRVSPPKVDERGRKVPDRNGSRASDAVLLAASKISVNLRSELSGSTRVRDLWTKYREYLVEQKRAQGTFDLYDRWAALFNTAYGDRILIEVPTDTVEEFLKAVAEGHGMGSARNARSMLSGMFRYAVRKRALPVNPVREAQLVKNVEAKGPTGGAGHIEVDDLRFILTAVRGSVLPCPRKLTKKERERTTPIKSYTPPTVAEYCEEADLADLVTLAAAVGQRPSQLLGLEWSDIELDVKRVRTSGKVIRIRGVGLVRVVIANDPKNPGGTVALPDFAVEMLRRRKAMLATRRLASPPMGKETLNLVFPSRTWGLRDPNNVQHEWQRVREALGLPDDVTVYSFRKLVATVLDDAGLSARMTADVLQHADPAMTQRKYMARGRAHPEAAAAMDRAVVGDAGRAN
jgi:integrase